MAESIQTMGTIFTTTTPPRKNSTPSQLTHKMSHLLGLNNGSTSTVVIYFGSMRFLDNQASFSSVFGPEEILFGSISAQLDANNTGIKLRTCAENSMFDIFLEIYKAAYAGT